MRDQLVAAVLRGEKTSTTGLYEEYVRTGERLTEVGSHALVIDSEGHGVAVIETTSVEVKRMGDVDLAFAVDEGEGFETVAQWRDAHVRFFESPELAAVLGDPPVAIDDGTLVVCERFRVVERLTRAGSPECFGAESAQFRHSFRATVSRMTTAMTPWGKATVVEEIALAQRNGEDRFASLVQLLETTTGDVLVRFAYSKDGVARRGPVTLRPRDLERLRSALARSPRLREALLG